MASEYDIYRLCPVCDGDGVVTAPSSTPPYPLEDKECPKCLGANVKNPRSGGLFWGWMFKGKGPE